MTKGKRTQLKEKGKNAVMSGIARNPHRLWLHLGKENLSRSTAYDIFGEIIEEILESEHSDLAV